MIFFKRIYSCYFVRTINSDIIIHFKLKGGPYMDEENKNITQQLLKPKNDIVFQSLFTKNNAKITKFQECMEKQ